MADHIQLHQGWMRNFRNDEKKGAQVYCFNVGLQKIKDDTNIINVSEIGSIKIKSLGAINNYYIEDFEHYLDKEWESKFGVINKHIMNENKKNLDKIMLSNEQIDFIKSFIAVSMGRSIFMKKEVIKHDESPFVFIGINEITPLSIITEELKLFENMDIQFLRNTSSLGFVLPSFSYYYVKTQYECVPIVVLSDKLAIRFITRTNQDDVSCAVLNIEDDEIIKDYNYYAMITEFNTNRQFIIAKHKRELECLLTGE